MYTSHGHVAVCCTLRRAHATARQHRTHVYRKYTNSPPTPRLSACLRLSSLVAARKTGTKRISITLRERKETLPPFLLPVPECRCGAPASLTSRVLESGRVDYLFQCDRARGACGFTLFKGPRR